MLSGYRGTRLPGGPGSGPLKSRVTRWRVRVRPPEFGGYPFAAGTGTRRVAPRYHTLRNPFHLYRLWRSQTLILRSNGPLTLKRYVRVAEDATSLTEWRTLLSNSSYSYLSALNSYPKRTLRLLSSLLGYSGNPPH